MTPPHRTPPAPGNARASLLTWRAAGLVARPFPEVTA